MRQWATAIAAAALAGLGFGQAWAEEAAYDELPEGAAEEVARLYYSALALPGVSGWGGAMRLALLDAATLRHRDRLVDRAAAPAEAARRHVERLAGSELSRANPGAVGVACARHGLLEGACAAHRGFVRRTLVVEEMLAQGQLTLAALEAELAGAARPGLADGRRAR